VAHAIRVGLDRFVLDALDRDAPQERVEPANRRVMRPPSARVAFGSMNSQACSSISQSISWPTRRSRGRRNKRVYQSTLASRSDTETPAKRCVIRHVSGPASTSATASIASSRSLIRPEGGVELIGRYRFVPDRAVTDPQLLCRPVGPKEGAASSGDTRLVGRESAA